MSEAALLDATSSAAELPAGLVRAPRPSRKKRPQAFLDAFDATGLAYDCFRHADGKRVLLIGPPPLKLDPYYRLARFTALPSRTVVRARFHISLSVLVIELDDVPEGDSAIAVEIGKWRGELIIQPNLSPTLAGRRLLFSMSKDNELGWIREWAAFHARHHGTDAVVLYDNGSTRYSVPEIEETLRAVPGIAAVAVPVWRQKFGRTDPVLKLNPYWAHFPQIASMSDVLRRYGAAAHGILNCDIDELARPLSGTTIYDAARRSRAGLAVFRGEWIEAVAGEARHNDHRDFTQRLKDPKAARSRPNKWAIDPSRPWLQKLGVHPYWHWIVGRPLFAKVTPPGAGYWHFRGINTNWKADRTAQRGGADALETDPELVAAFAGDDA